VSGTATAAAGVAAVLLVSGLGKTVEPKPLYMALDELGLPKSLNSYVVIRAVGLTEVAAAVLLLVPSTQTIGGLSIVGLGTCMIATGLTARRQKVDRPCGCFGNVKGRPLGWTSVGFGILFLLGGALILSSQTTATSISLFHSDGVETAGSTILLTATFAQVAAAVVWRSSIGEYAHEPFSRVVRSNRE